MEKNKQCFYFSLMMSFESHVSSGEDIPASQRIRLELEQAKNILYDDTQFSNKFNKAQNQIYSMEENDENYQSVSNMRDSLRRDIKGRLNSFNYPNVVSDLIMSDYLPTKDYFRRRTTAERTNPVHDELIAESSVPREDHHDNSEHLENPEVVEPPHNRLGSRAINILLDPFF